jgi:hypothetical protein
VVKGIEKLASELQAHCLVDREVLVDRKVREEASRSGKDTGSRISENPQSRAVKHDVSNHLAAVGLLRFPLHARVGRTEEIPTFAESPLHVIVNGSPL